LDNYPNCKDNENYKVLPAMMAQQTLKMVDRGMRSFIGLLKLAKKEGYANPIRLPNYLDKQGYFMLEIPHHERGGFKIKDGKIHLAISKLLKQETGLKNLVFNFPKNVDPKTVKEIRIHPKHNAHYFTVEVVYEVKEQEKTNATGILGVDVGLNNLATCWDTKNSRSFIIDGRKVKSINHYWNKRNAELQSTKDKQGYNHYTHKQFLNTRKRNRRIRDYMHKAARKIVNYALANGVGKIVVGHNVGWKDEVNLGKKTNQNFVQVPFGLLMEHLRYKCQEVGLVYQEICESHTSKCSFLDLEKIKHQDKYVGKRIKRGLFRSAKGICVNADVNGAGNIARKVTVDYSLNGEQIKGFVANPLRMKIA
jgi:IS605 OrfB family transposase